jgi:hypothetical protein
MLSRAVCVGACLAALLLPAGAAAHVNVQLITRLSPDRLGASTAVTVGFRIRSTSAGLPPPLVHMSIALPAGLGFASSTLGTATCESSMLSGDDARDCPTNAVMGFGTDVVEVPLGPTIIRESAQVTAFMAPSADMHTSLLFFAQAQSPIIASLVFGAELFEGDVAGGFGTLIETTVPLIPSTPGGPDASVVSFETTLGPRRLTYYRRVHGKTLGYRPAGLTVPSVCPRHGFPFSAKLVFLDGTEASAHSTVPCPRA